MENDEIFMNGIKAFFDSIGEDKDREGLLKTPLRVLKAWKEMTIGYQQSPSDILSTCFCDNIGEHHDVVICKNISFHSLCEHHILPFSGICHIGYIPENSVVGLSKLPKLVECYARRLQIQERMTSDIANSINEIIRPRGVAVVIEAKHQCVACRGAKNPTSEMITSVMLGSFRDNPSTRAEFLNLCSK